MKLLGLLVLAAVVLLLSSTPAAVGAGGGTLSLTVYADGYVHVSQTLPVATNATSVQVRLLSPAVYDLVATDQDGSPLSYGFAPGGSNITVYTLGASLVALGYDTSSLTSKNGTVWTLAFASAYNSTLVLPPLSTLSLASGTPYPAPYSINKTGESIELALAPGSWDVSYGVPFSEVTSAETSATGTGTTGTSTAGSNPGGSGGLGLEAVAGALALAAAVGAAFALWRRRGSMTGKGELRPDDVQVLDFVRSRGGKVLEPEIRTRFALPKTSAWRQIKRLERLGYVRVTKVGSQNQIELLRERSPEG